MKIYFDGCSFTYGSELKDRLKSRYSRLLCDHFDAEEYNIAKGGGSNRRIARNLLEHDLSQYDMVVLQMTKRQRTEYYSHKHWQRVSWAKVVRNGIMSRKNNTSSKHWGRAERDDGNYERYVKDRDFWETYYRDIYNDEYGKSDEKIYYNLFKGLLRNKPHVILSIEKKPSVPVDIMIDKNIPRVTSKYDSHPNAEGHKLISKKIIDCYEDLF